MIWTRIRTEYCVLLGALTFWNCCHSFFFTFLWVCEYLKTLSFLIAFFYCITTSSLFVSGPLFISKHNLLHQVTARQRSYVTLSTTKPEPDDLERLHLFSLLTIVRGLFFGFVRSVFFFVCIHRHLRARRRHDMKVGFVIEAVVALYLLFAPAQVRLNS